MCDYKELIILSYFYQKNRRYVLSDLRILLGFTMSQLEEKIFSLIERGFIEYKENLIEIKEKGIETIVINKIEAFPFEFNEDDNVYNTIDFLEKLSVYDVYIPKKFKNT